MSQVNDEIRKVSLEVSEMHKNLVERPNESYFISMQERIWSQLRVNKIDDVPVPEYFSDLQNNVMTQVSGASIKKMQRVRWIMSIAAMGLLCILAVQVFYKANLEEVQNDSIEIAFYYLENYQDEWTSSQLLETDLVDIDLINETFNSENITDIFIEDMSLEEVDISWVDELLSAEEMIEF